MRLLVVVMVLLAAGVGAEDSAAPVLLDVGSSIKGSGGASASADNAFTGTNTFTQGIVIPSNSGAVFGAFGTGATIMNSTGQVPAAPMLLTGTVSNSFIVAETADRSFSFAHPLATNPTLFVHSANQSTTEWLSLKSAGALGTFEVGGTGNFLFNAAGASNGATTLSIATGYTSIGADSAQRLTLTASNTPKNAGIAFVTGSCGVGNIQNMEYKPALATTLVDATVTSLVRMSIRADTGGGGVLTYMVTATSGTTVQSRAGSIPFAATYSTAGATVACVFGTPSDVFSGSGTMTLAFDCIDNSLPYFLMRVTADTSLNVAPTMMWTMQWLANNGCGIVAAQP